jgi:hypothetical protein
MTPGEEGCMELRHRSVRDLGAGLVVTLSLALAGSAGAADPDAARTRPLPEGVEAGSVPEGVEAEPLPEGEAAEPLPDAPPASRDRAAPADAERVVWEAKREGVEDRLRGTRLEVGEARERLGAACGDAEAEGCGELRRDVRRLESQVRALEAYLETGLLAECLRTACDRDWLGETPSAR